MMFLPQYPYLPLGTLRGAAAYPQGPDAFSEAEIVAAMEKVGLAEFRDMLDVEERWDRILSLGQQQRLAFVRLLLHKPLWVFLDEATGALDEANQTRVMTLVNEELSESTIVSIGHRPSLAAFHNRTLNLVPTPSGARLRRRQHPTVTAGWLQSVLGKMWKPRRPTPGDRI